MNPLTDGVIFDVLCKSVKLFVKLGGEALLPPCFLAASEWVLDLGILEFKLVSKRSCVLDVAILDESKSILCS